MNMNSFVDEVGKIAAMKYRTGRRSIRADNLVKKERIDRTTSTKLGGIADIAKGVGSAAKSVGGALWKAKKPLAIAGGSILGYEALKKNVRAWQLGRQLQEQGYQ